MNNWYYAVGDAQQGPVSFAALRQLLSDGRVPPDALVWYADMPNWLPANSMPQFADISLTSGTPLPRDPSVLGYGVGNSVYSNDGSAPRYAGFLIRVGASIIDGLIIGIPFRILDAAAHAASVPSPGRPVSAVVTALIGLLGLLQLVAFWLYSAILESSDRMATLGKQICGLKAADEAGRKLTFGRATGRHFAKFFSVITLGIGYLMVAWTRKKQGLHDLIAGTVVLRQPGK